MEREMEVMRRHTESTSNVDWKHQELCGVGDRGPQKDASVPYISGGPLDYLKDVYEVDENGQIRFIVRFDVVGYGPEDIEVSTSSHGLTVHAKKSLQKETETNTQEYIRTIYLPSSIDKNHFVGHLSEDGVLILEAPVNSGAYKSITFNGDRQLAVKPHCDQESSLSRDGRNVTSMTIQLTGKLMLFNFVDLKFLRCKPEKGNQQQGNCGPTVLQDDVSGRRKVHVEVPIEPEFSADDLCVRMDTNCMIVSGRKQCVNESESSQKNVYVKEFTRSYNIPETVDTFSVNTQLHGNTLLVEAPLLYSATSH
ncbi:hypothetical protein AHF37_02761 [Paragonimus kellicotti]|nr:hypothetical protein AHF37_02761 [Paragonimus kellicotti]